MSFYCWFTVTVIVLCLFTFNGDRGAFGKINFSYPLEFSVEYSERFRRGRPEKIRGRRVVLNAAVLICRTFDLTATGYAFVLDFRDETSETRLISVRPPQPREDRGRGPVVNRVSSTGF